MKRARPVMLGFSVMLVILVFWVLAFLIAFLTQMSRKGSVSVSIDVMVIITMLILAAEIVFYWDRRYKIPNKVWVHIHVWSSFLAIVVIPIIAIILMYMYQRSYYANLPSETEYFRHTQFMTGFVEVLLYVFWGLLAIGHIFFIATIVKSFQLKAPKTDESAGLLDEFVDRR